MSDKVVLGIHSAVVKQTQDNGGSFDRFTDGHAWLSVTRNGTTEYYGVWPDDHPRVKDNGDGTDIRVGLEKGFASSADRYYELSPAQVKKLDAALKGNVEWSPTTTCAGWASDTVTSVTGRRIDATEFLSIETPRELVKSIRALEAKEPTAPDAPRAPIQPGTSSSMRGDDALEARPDAKRGTPHAALADPLYLQAEEAVRRLDAGMGRAYDQHSACMTASAAGLARTNGFERIDHVVLNEATASLPKGENVFVVQGGLTDATNRVAYMRTQDALTTPAEQSLDRLARLTPDRTPQRDEPALDVPIRQQAVQRMTG